MRVGALGLLLCAAMTATQVPTWRSDAALWGWAKTVSPNLPRPALNYAFAIIETDREEGLRWLIHAAHLASGHPREPEIRALIRHRLRWVEAFGGQVCGRPLVQPLCS